MDFCTTFRCLQWKHKFSQQSWDCSLSVFQGQVLPLVVDIKGQINISSAHTCPHCLLQSPPCSVLKATLVTLPCFTWVRQSGQTQVICLDASEMIKKQSSIKRSGSQVINTHPCGKWGSGFLKRMKGEEGNSVTHEILWGQVTSFHFWDHLPQQSFTVSPSQHSPPNCFWSLQTRQSESITDVLEMILFRHWEEVSKYLWVSGCRRCRRFYAHWFSGCPGETTDSKSYTLHFVTPRDITESSSLL